LIPDFFVQDTTRTNSAASPDTVGNSLLKPELATGVDISYETSFGKNGFASLGAFYRDVDNIVANTTTLQTVYWASQPRWVSQPTNFSHGTSYGIEMEFRAGAADLLPAALQPKMPLNFRLNLNYYGSQVDGVPGPDNRFPSQSPWKTTIGFDYKPIDNLTLGGSIYFAPEYMRRITAIQTFKQMPLRWINAFARYSIDKRSNIRVGINNLFPSSNATEAVTDLSSVNAVRSGRTNISVTIETQLK
jgi:iron complex outermembrane receptor protein